MWDFDAKECGFDITYVASLKLIYVKYLIELDQWLSHSGFKDIELENGELDAFEKLDWLFHNLKGYKCALSSVGYEADKKGKCGIQVVSSGDESIERGLEFKEKLDFDMKAKMGLSGIKTINGNDEEFGGFDLNIDQTEFEFARISNADDKDEIFGGLDLNIAHSELGFDDDTDEMFGGLDLNIAQTEFGFSEISNFDEKDECDGMNLNIAQTEFGFSRTNNVDERDKVISGLDERKIDLSSDITVKTVNIKLCPMDVLSSQSKNNTVILSKNVKTVGRPRKRKKEEPFSSFKMLEWLANAARNPHDVTIGTIPRNSKWKKYKGNEVWKQVLLVKETLFAKQNVDSGNKLDCSQKKRHMMHPSMYEDDKIPIHLSSKRIRCSQRVSSVKSCSCPGCTSCSSSQNKRVKKTPQILETIETQDDICEDPDTESESDIVRAEVPEWSGVASESDPKWLGTRMWPSLEDNNIIHQMDNVVIGKGRQSSCACLNRGSADCVRFHIAENRTKVKHTLGPLFYKWKFDHMGEEALVSSWSLDEESEFKSLVIKARQELTDKTKSRHEIMSNFWRRASESIPSKTKDVLVSYYFNVFVLRRRSYQNRINPDNIDSDDDEQEVGCEKIHNLYAKAPNKLCSDCVT